MKQFLAIYIGTDDAFKRSRWNELTDDARKAREASGIRAWKDWRTANLAAIVVQAESHEAAAKLFVNHPHFTIFPGDSVEIMPCLPIPEQ